MFSMWDNQCNALSILSPGRAFESWDAINEKADHSDLTGFRQGQVVSLAVEVQREFWTAWALAAGGGMTTHEGKGLNWMKSQRVGPNDLLWFGGHLKLGDYILRQSSYYIPCHCRLFSKRASVIENRVLLLYWEDLGSVPV